VFRQASTSDIIHNSHAVIKSNTSDFRFGSKERKSDCFFTETTSDYREMHSTIAKHYIRMKDLGNAKDEISILCPTRKGIFGTEAINKLIQSMNPNTESIRANGCDLKVGDMVMQNVNNYDLEVFNGEVGEIIDFSDNGTASTITVKYSDKEVVYSKQHGHFQELELAYAITIHKSQGSEYRAVIFVCAKEHSMMLTKNLIYTGFTRAKELLSIIGQKEALITGADKKTEISRKSYLIERLGGK
jgi:exodeoxyribonuclease V alpha subunit